MRALAAGGGLGVAEHDADLLADLVDEDEAGARLGDRSGELAEGLGHQACLQAHVGVAHLAVELGLGDQGGDRVDDQDVDGAGADQGFDDLKRLLAVVGLRDEQVVGVYAELFGVGGVEGVLGVDEGGEAAGLLGLGDDLEGDGGFTGAFRAEYLDDAATGNAADAEGGVEGDGTGGDDGDGTDGFLGAEAHDRAFAELLVELGKGGFNGLAAVVCHGDSPRVHR